jgi:hypothetical protein
MADTPPPPSTEHPSKWTRTPFAYTEREIRDAARLSRGLWGGSIIVHQPHRPGGRTHSHRISATGRLGPAIPFKGGPS